MRSIQYINLQEQVWISDENEADANLSLTLKVSQDYDRDAVTGQIIYDRTSIDLINLKLYKPNSDEIITMDSVPANYQLQISEIAEAMILNVKSNPGEYLE